MFGPCRWMSVCLCVHMFVCLHSPSESIWKKAFPESHLRKLMGQFFIYTGQPHPPHSGHRESFPVHHPQGGLASLIVMALIPSSLLLLFLDLLLLLGAWYMALYSHLPTQLGQLMGRVTMDTVIKVSESYFLGLQMRENVFFLVQLWSSGRQWVSCLMLPVCEVLT